MLSEEVKAQVLTDVQDEVSTRLSRMSAAANDETIRRVIGEAVRVAVRRYAQNEITDDEVKEFIQECVSEFLRYGPLEPLMDDDTITEIMVNGAGFDENGIMKPPVCWVERDGQLYKCPNVKFKNEAHVRRIMSRIASRANRRLDDAHPIVDAALYDGSRFNGTLYPIAPDGSTFNIRRFRKDAVTYKELLAIGTLTEPEIRFLGSAVAAKCSILISGGTGSGKTTMLNILSGFIPEGERVITIEDTCELLVHKRLEHVVRFEGRQANAEGAGEITLDDHLKAALRKRPDRIIIGECRGSEAYTMLEAMNTGHEGSMTTIHANNPTAALSRLITLVKQGESTLSEETIKAKIADAIDIIVQVNRFPDGTRKVVSIEQVGAYSDGVIQHDTLWEFVREGIDSNKNVVGEHQSKNIQPTALKNKIEEAGVVYDQNWFIDQHFPVNK